MGKKPEKNGGKTKSTDFDTFEYENFDTARAGNFQENPLSIVSPGSLSTPASPVDPASPNAQEDRLRQLFADIDTDESGSLDQDEIAALAKSLGLALTKKELRAAMADILSHSAPGSSEADFDGFQHWWANRDKSSRFGHATVSKIRIDYDDVTPECFRGDDADVEVDAALFLSWTAKIKEVEESQWRDGGSGENSREAKNEQAAFQAMKDQKCVIDPESKYRKAWDVLQIFLLVYVAGVVPYRIGFGKDVLLWSGWFWFDLALDIYFIADLQLSFRTAFYSGEGDLEYEPRQIARHYIRGWFTIDMLSCLPVNYVTFLPGVNAQSEDMKGNKMFRMLRLLRLLKLLRLARLNRLIARYEQEYYHLVSSFKILKVILIVGCISHWMCCAWFAAGSQESQFMDGEGNMLQGWVSRYFGGKSNTSGIHQYSIALYWSMMTMTTVGYGDIAPQTEYEYWFVTFAMLLGGFVFGMIVGFLGDMSKDANPEESLRTRSAALLNALLIRGAMDRASPNFMGLASLGLDIGFFCDSLYSVLLLNVFLVLDFLELALSCRRLIRQEKHPELIRRVRNFKAHHDSVQTAMDTLGMMKAMPWSLTSELAISMQWIDGLHSLHDGSHGHVFRPGILHRVPFFHGLSEMSTITICSRMKHLLVEGPNNKKPEEHRRKRDYIFEAGDEGHEMYIVLQGLVLVEEPLVEEASLLVEGVNAKPAVLPTAAILVEERLVEEANVLAENTPPAVNGKREVSLSPAPLAPIGALRDGDFFGENGILVPPETRPQRMRSAYAEVETTLASLSYYDVLQLRHEDSSLNAAMLPFMERASGDGVANLHRHPGQFAFVHDRIDALEKRLEAKLDRLLANQNLPPVEEGGARRAAPQMQATEEGTFESEERPGQ